MFSKRTRDQVVGGMIIGSIALGLAGYWFATDHMDGTKVAGFLVGLWAGFVSVIAGHMWERSKQNKLLRIFFIGLSPIGMFAMLPFSPGFAGGYFLGSGVSFAFSWAVRCIIEKDKHRSAVPHANPPTVG